jgi:hypothetical protein
MSQVLCKTAGPGPAAAVAWAERVLDALDPDNPEVLY